MKKITLFSLFCSLLVIVSCNKSLNEPNHVAPETTTTAPNANRLGIASDPTAVLTSQTWVYYEYFLDFNTNPTKLVWKTNRTSNSLNLASNEVKFYTNGNYTEIDQNGITYNGTWTFLTNPTRVRVTSSQGTFTSTIQLLDSSRYEWLDSTGRYGVMVPKNQVIDTTGGKLQLLTSQPWVYTEYFNGFNQTTPSLVWKPNKSNSPLNLGANWVKFETNGNYTEIDQNGITYNGTWAFDNNQTQVRVTNPLGTFISTIKVLSTDRYEWLSSNGVTYGEMKHP